jgi:osmoprotectant transport system permease protein
VNRGILKAAARPDRVAAVAITIVVLSLFLPFQAFRENRITQGSPQYVVEVLGPFEVGVLFGLVAACALLAVFQKERPRLIAVSGVLANAIFVASFILLQRGAADQLADAADSARVSIGSGGWLLILGSYLLLASSAKRTVDGKLLKSGMAVGGVIVVGVLLVSGQLSDLSVVREYSVRSERFAEAFSEHLALAFSAVGLAAMIGVPLGVAAVRRKPLEKGLFLVVNVFQTIPSLALFGIMVAPISFLAARIRLFEALGVRGIGWAPAVVALTLYALLPLARNAFSSVKGIDPEVIAAGRGMGMSRWQILSTIEIPLALPVMLGGLRTATVQAVGNTTIAALIGAGGFGVFVFQGLGQSVPDLILLGAVPVVILAVVTDRVLAALISLVTPQGVKLQAAAGSQET